MSAQPLPLRPLESPVTGLAVPPPATSPDPDAPPPSLAELIRQYADHSQLLSRMSHPYAQAVDVAGLDVAERRWVSVDDAEDDLDLWLISWPPDARTGWHDHGGIGGALTVLDGTLSEAVWDGVARVEPLRQGTSRCFGEQRIHDVVNTSGRPALSLHAYSPGLTTMTHYSLVEGIGGSRLCVAGVEVAGGHW